MKTVKMSVFLLALIAGVFVYGKISRAAVLPESRRVMLVAEQLVREVKPTPVQSSRYYAVVATEYYKSMSNDTKYDSSTSTMTNILNDIIAQDTQTIVTGTQPIGAQYWKSDKAPFSPNAAKLSRFVIDNDFKYVVPQPPLYGGREFNEGLQSVKVASYNRTSEQSAAINFWGGVPGTEAPAGIWQNRLYDEVRKYNLSDEDYAYAQMIMAQTVADAFVECWKVKYAYWTARPDMSDDSIVTAMPNPPFPSYVSGHSTISYAAASVLSVMFPDEAETFNSDALEAKNSRLWAGIHFPYDNDEGAKLGTAVGDYAVSKLEVKRVR